MSTSAEPPTDEFETGAEPVGELREDASAPRRLDVPVTLATLSAAD
jgi:hypothetical protein